MAKTNDNDARLRQALLAMRKMRAKIEELEKAQEKEDQTREPIAITGVGCRFPGGIVNLDSFWQVLQNETDAIDVVPASRFDVDEYYDERPATAGKMMSRLGGYLSDIDQFDSQFFGVNSREAERLDPQQRILLEVAWEALEDAGYQLDEASQKSAGVFLGIWLNEFEHRLFKDTDKLDFYMTNGSGRYTAAGRLSYFLNFHGPSMAVDSACSSSLVAVHLACQSIWTGECSMALAGGSNLILQPHVTIAYSQSKMIAPDGRCKFGSSAVNGFVRSEGVALLVLKPLSKAIEDGDRIHGLIRGTAVNNDGQSSGSLGRPAAHGQEITMRRALDVAGIKPNQIGYVEAHGTGTPVGDPVEIGVISKVVGEERPKDKPFYVGSVKTNIGHTEGAAGVAGLIKAMLTLKHRSIPKSLHSSELNPDIPWDDMPLVIPQQMESWPTYIDETAYAGVSSFGINGTNGHVVLSEPPQQDAAAGQDQSADGQLVLPLSAHTPDALRQRAQELNDYLSDEKSAPLGDIAYTLARRRNHLAHRNVFVAGSKSELGQQLSDYVEAASSSAEELLDLAPKTVFIFPGQGSQWVGMGRQLLETEPAFAQVLAACEREMAEFVNWSLSKQLALEPDDPDYRLNQIDVIQPTLLSIEIGLAELWRSWGVTPDAVIGHSMGEVAAAYIAGALSLKDAMRVICERSILLRRTSGQGAMAVVELDMGQAAQAIRGYEDRVAIAVSNSDRSTVLSGDPAALDEIIATLQSKDVFCRLVKVDVASHSPQMDPLKADLLSVLAPLEPQDGQVPIYSTATGVILSGGIMDPSYWVKNLRQPVLFSMMVQKLLAADHTIFIEMSPHPILLPSVEQGFPADNEQARVTVASLRRGSEEQAMMLQNLGQLYRAGFDVDWKCLFPHQSNVATLPNYPWQRETFWYDGGEPSTRRSQSGSHPFLFERIQLATGEQMFEGEIDLSRFAYLNDHQVRGQAVLPATAMIELFSAVAAELFPDRLSQLEDLTFDEAIFLNDEAETHVQLFVKMEHAEKYAVELFTSSSDEWTRMASGSVRTASGFDIPLVTSKVAALKDEEPIAADVHYENMRRRQLQYGPAFQGVSKIWPGQNQFTADIFVENTADMVGKYQLHPALLDACLQPLLSLNYEHQGGGTTATYLPVRVKAVKIIDQIDLTAPGLSVYATANLAGDTLTADVFVLDGDGMVCVVIEQLDLQALQGSASAELDQMLFEVNWQSAPSNAQAAGLKNEGAWLIVADQFGVADELRDQLQTVMQTTYLATLDGDEFTQANERQFQLSAGDAGHFEQLISAVSDQESAGLQGVVYLGGFSLENAPITIEQIHAAQDHAVLGAIHLAQACANLKSRLWLVTHAAVATGDHAMTLPQSSMWGIGSTISNELPLLDCTRLDLMTDSEASAADYAQLLFDELTNASDERQIAVRADARYVARLQQADWPSAETESSVQPIDPDEDAVYQLHMPTPGILDNMILQAVSRRAPQAGEIEIKIEAAALNFIDVMKAMGICPGFDPAVPPALGGECSGRVVAIGEGVAGLQMGDRVMVLTPSFVDTTLLGSYATVPAVLALPQQPELDARDATTMPIAYLTAYYAMNHLGRLRKGEKVLIHSATGGVGLAAVQLAQYVGAEIFATAGTPEKRAYLREMGIQHVMDSRSLDFADEVMEITNGGGVDMVLNSLSGEAIPKNISILAPYGRFLEIGKRDIYDNSRIGLEPFKRNLSFFAVDLAQMVIDRPAAIRELLDEVNALINEGTISPLPRETFSITDVSSAFRFMAQAKHIGKVVIDMQQTPTELVASQTILKADASYMITGGLGALGLLTAQTFADNGAKSVVLLGRSAPSISAKEIIAEIESKGCQVTVLAADVSDKASLQSVFAHIDHHLPPLAGIVHSAGVLDDGIITELNQSKMWTPMRPKIDGGWNLHELSINRPLDFMVLFSSAATTLGTTGQGNYAAANAFMDTLVSYRKGLGLPTLSINWGPWGQVGLAAAQDNRGNRLAYQGLTSISPEIGMMGMMRLLGEPHAHVAIMPFDASTWTQFYPAAAETFFADLIIDSESESGVEQVTNIVDALHATPAGRARQQAFEAYTREQVARVLNLPVERVPLRKPLKTLGFDSLMTLELRNRLEGALRIKLSATLVFNYPTVAEMTQHLADKLDISLDESEDAAAEPTKEAAPV